MKSEMVFTVSLLFFSILGFQTVSAQTNENPLQDKSKISYALGYLNGQAVVQGDHQSFYQSMNVERYMLGFKSNIHSRELVDSCNTILMEPYILVEDSMVMRDLGVLSECQGRYMSSTFCGQIIDAEMATVIDNNDFAAGFEDNILMREPRYPLTEMQELASKLGEQVEAEERAELEAKNATVLAKATAWKKAKKLENGIIIRTVKKGKGKSKPSVESDISVHYVVIDNDGKQMESSYEMGSPLTINLNSLIEGWKTSLIHMQKGGKYEVFIPSDLAYENGHLIFTIELLDFGVAGSLVK